MLPVNKARKNKKSKKKAKNKTFENVARQ